ncbi:MAG TPA: nickel ABC transporter permease [Candidatus Dormibacteraeota bacterium]|nr:nickel ABC transporter permease [Candidatus Dormibacteraeota bacterium]
MAQYVARRLVAMVPVLLLVSILVFLMIYLTPGDPVQIMLGQSGASAAQVAQVRHELGLDRPLPVQYLKFLENLLSGQERSIATQQPVVSEFLGLFPSTLQLAMASLVIAVALGIALGVLAATHPRTWVDYLSMAVSFMGVSVPNFWLALLLIYLFAVQLNWLPATGGGSWRQLVLPAVVLAVQQVALIARLVRASMLEALQEDYIKTARAKGLPERAVRLRHAFRNALLPIVTLLGLNFGYLLSGAVIVEIVFARPGIGRLIVDAIQAKDFPLVQGAILMTAVVYLVVNLLTDLSYAVIDPRIRY